ncbi:MAG: 16S rRNA (cytosine(967)-C(5))-methyltransferase RsmB [Mizugakiibacter sp.]|uniref:16S rRNA (cytosine(967)-C(5))-methyltransferase RsmB n=1 Tax=Mizugakiibacter sp. TaxID=1972610 RepID=UPI0031C47437|nr:16S rRNA (cytosine(967)-C(5))-methyltransferase RsmB [Xanthomonadaceae bacterium]
MSDARALAAQALAEVALGGASLREVGERVAPRLPDPRDRALLTALLAEGARWWLRYDRALDRLLEQPLRTREPALHALLVLGLVQLEVMGLAPYAAVAASVEAARALKRPRFAGLVNAVLRRWQRERATHLAALDADAATRHAHPAWLIDALRADWPAEAERVLAANNAAAPPMLRVNRRRAAREGVIDALREAGVAVRPHAWLADALVLEASTDVARLPGFAQGTFAVQDGAAQLAADLLDAHAGMRVLDACAAPGGKACHLLERADVELLALEREPARLARVRQNLERLGLAAELRAGDAGDPPAWWDGRPFERILIDAPCSATGVIRRRPDVKLHRRAADIPALAAGQARLLAALWPLLAPGGRLLYATCSLLRAENRAVTDGFLATHADACAVTPALPAGRADGPGWQLLPGDDGLDGMYYAVLDKRSA